MSTPRLSPPPLRGPSADLVALPAVLGALLLTTASGCGLLLGNIKPVDEKSKAVGVMDLASVQPDWVRLDGTAGTAGTTEKSERGSTSSGATAGATEIPDVAYQSKKNASLISMNSACRPSHADVDPSDDPHVDLRTFTQELLLGVTEIESREEMDLVVESTPALQTTVRGKLSGEAMALRTVVLRRGTCIYDLLYFSRPQHFAEHEGDFDRFVKSLRLN